MGLYKRKKFKGPNIYVIDRIIISLDKPKILGETFVFELEKEIKKTLQKIGLPNVKFHIILE